VTAVPGSALSGNLVARWSALQLADPELASPFFRPEFTQAVARVRDGVFVAVVEDGRVPVGFLPFERARLGIGKPVGRQLSDYQGAVMQEGADWDPACVVRACRLQAWDFDHLPASQREFSPFHVRGTASPQLDLARGFEAYCSDHRASGSRAIPKTRAKERRLERDHGALRFSAQSADVGALRELVRLKSAQYRNSGVRDVFAAPWPVELLEALDAPVRKKVAFVSCACSSGSAVCTCDGRSSSKVTATGIRPPRRRFATASRMSPASTGR
jgi:CelD/BcsL family acetyltransferase involved in cellulose biosynthesis